MRVHLVPTVREEVGQPPACRRADEADSSGHSPATMTCPATCRDTRPRAPRAMRRPRAAPRHGTTQHCMHNAMQYIHTILQVPHHVRAVQQPRPPRVRGPGPAPASPPPAALRRPRPGDAPEPRGGRGPAARAQGGVAGEAGWGRGARIQLDICCRRCTWTRASRGRGATRCC